MIFGQTKKLLLNFLNLNIGKHLSLKTVESAFNLWYISFYNGNMNLNFKNAQISII